MMKENIFLIGLFATVFMSCDKYLDRIPDRSRAVLSTVVQYEHLMNYNQLYMSAPALGEMGADFYYLPKEIWLSSNIRMRPAYIWQADIYQGNTASGATQDWNSPYNNIYYTNVVLDGIELLNAEKGSASYHNVKGHALFLRAFQHYQLQEVYGQPYRPATAGTDLGIPLKLTSDLEEPVHRATVAQTFTQITDDLTAAYTHFSTTYQAVNKLWGSKAAVAALLSRVYLTMQEYELSAHYATESLKHQSSLLDLNTLAPRFQFTFPDNQEMIFVLRQAGWGGVFNASTTLVDTNLYQLYAADDLRKEVYFQKGSNNKPYFKSLFSGNSSPFSGLAVGEVYLNRAECRARLGDESGALEDLNTLLAHRYKNGLFTPLTLEDTGDVLSTVLLERQKEMIVRGTRWTDLRRLNQDPRFAVTLMRRWGDEVHILPPNDPRYTYPIPDNEIAINNLPQNLR